ncbi:MAG: response regulator transcription factor [Planctomycetota bacterium]|nr:response regulator transcription factor [Planctomycetota bacterium]
MTSKILFIDDHEIVRLGLRQMLLGTEMEIVDEASTSEDGYNKFLAGKFDLVLLDVRIPGGDGLQLLAKIKMHSPTQPVLVFSAYDNPTYVARAVALGANGFLLKTDSQERILDSILRTSKGESTWSREELRRVTGSLATMRMGTDSEIPLTQREGEVLKQLANGLTNKEIALSLGISYETVKEHVQHILRKIGVSDRTQAAVWAVRKNLV